MNKEMMNTKEVAEFLNINEKQVYKLIKEGKLPGTRITGKWIFPRRLVEEWIMKSAKDNLPEKSRVREIINHVIVMGSNDSTIELLSQELVKRFPEFTMSLANVGSIGGLVALQRGSAHIAGCHLLHPKTGEYNIPYIKKYLSDIDPVIINLSYREQGLIVKKGNPLKINSFNDLKRQGIKIINRQQGSGTRILMDFKLDEAGIDKEKLDGYSRELITHTEVAISVLSGVADMGLGILSAARVLGLDFIPITKERYDLVIPKEIYNTKLITSLLGIINSREFKGKVEQMGGYDMRDSGSIM
ncbi:MAG: substrate-binding domain-containing protein [Thermodesulfobacteriota bacterium]|nr:substrate-binding domain-containing protein [Thermodesulfobacteriota bacterium]